MTARSAIRLRSLCLSVSHTSPRRAFAAQAASSASSSQAENAAEVSRPVKPTQWTRPHVSGEVPIYDMAMRIIEEDSARHKSEIVRLQALSEKEPQNEQLRRDIEKLEILSEVNVPEVRWKFENGYGKDVWTGRIEISRSRRRPVGEMSKPIYRYFEERRWREKGRLDLLVRTCFTPFDFPLFVRRCNGCSLCTLFPTFWR
jgi:large subunit ribosomal protein L35